MLKTKTPLIALWSLWLLLACGTEKGSREPDDSAPAPGPDTSESSGGASADVRRAIEGAINDAFPGVAICVVRAGALVWCEGFGVADTRSGEAVTADGTAFMLASVTKVVTATALLQLFEEGRLDLDAPMPDGIRHPHAGAPISARALLTHTAGIFDADSMDEFYAYGADTSLTLDEVVRGYFLPGGRWYSADDNFDGDGPGTRYEYSNMGIALAGWLVERTTGAEDLRAYSRRKIFAPLGMERSFWRLADRPEGVTIATPHAPGPVAPYTFADYPDGGLLSTAGDMARYALALIDGGGGILQPASLAEMWREQVPTIEPGQGLVWYRDEESPRFWRHDGGETGVATALLIDAARGDAIVVLGNGESDDDGPIDAIVGAIIADL